MSEQAIILGPTEGRKYALGRITAIFKADEQETRERYSVSEWWLDPQCQGVGPHSHAENDEIFYVIEGRPSVLIGSDWLDLPQGAFVRIPAGTVHDFRNLNENKACLLNVFIPGGFERNMPAIVDYFANERC
jgi:mannose-6-phosphate isomerase-like protein (cupin superfamily)